MVIIFVWTLYAVASAYLHHRLIQGFYKIDHGVSAFIRFVVCVVLWLLDPRGGLMGLTIFALACFFTFWLVFNLCLNAFRDLDWNYLGEDSALDRLESYIRENTFFDAFGIAVLKLILAAQLWFCYLRFYAL